MKELGKKSVNPPKESVRKLTIDDAHVGQRLDNFLLSLLKGVPKSRIYKLVRGGEVRVNGGRAAASQRLDEGDEVRIPPVRQAEAAPRPRTLPGDVTRLKPAILYRDDDLLVLDKPSGMAVHGGSGISRGVIEQLRLEFPEQHFMELAHRLDRETSGVLVVALKRRALTQLHHIFRQHRVDKRYLVLATGRWRDETRNVRLALHKFVTGEGERRVTVQEGGQAAHTIFHRLKTWPGFALLEAELKTGRTHQIRVHLAYLKHPIAGDDKYGNFPLNKVLMAQGLKRMFLHAASLSFEHPVSGEPLRFEAPLPQELQKFVDMLDKDASQV
ncbi:MAG TPA: RluA family pseudouridine synthase [Thiobacillaceae bacterium]|nr:RluA family pseudouridine synthase [Thiobacillaceae bacterium]